MNLKSKIEKIKPYLPSENFTTNFGIFLGIAVMIFGATKLPRHFENMEKKQHVKKEYAGLTVSEITQKDTDGDGVKDWEEYLWGTNPENKDSDGDGKSDLAFVEEKRLELQERNGKTGTEDSATEQLAREYFATIVALEESGGLTTEAMTNLATSFAENISFVELNNLYTKDTITQVPSTFENRLQYKEDISLKLSSGGLNSIGTEFSYIDQLTRDEYSRESARSALEGIANSYQIFAESISKMNVPADLVDTHVAFANALNNTGISLDLVHIFWDDPISGVQGLMQYKEYSGEVESGLIYFETYFANNGIL